MNESVDEINYQKNREVILNRAKDYYKSDKERLREQARDKYRNLSKEEKIEKRKYGRNRCNFSKNLYISCKVVKSTPNFFKISFISSCRIFNFLFISFISGALIDSTIFISFNAFFEPLISSLNSSIIMYFFECFKGKDIFGICFFGLVPKRPYSISVPLKRDIEDLMLC